MVDSNDLLLALGRVVRERERDDSAVKTPAPVASSEPLVDAIMAELAAPSDDPNIELESSAASELRPSAASERNAGRVDSVTTLAPRRRLWLGLPALAAAAGLSLLFGRGLFDTPSNPNRALPMYAAELEGSVASMRAVQKQTDGVLTLAPGTELTVLLRPHEPVTGAVYASVGIASATNPTAFELVTAHAVVATSGSMRVNFTVTTDLPPRGNVCTVVTRAEEERANFVAATEKGEGWQRFCWSFVRLGVEP